jgi:hypothetical protein
MTTKEFVDKHIGLKVDFDGHFGAQCVDLFRQFCLEVWNVPHLGGVEGAKDLYLNYEKMPTEVKYTIRIEYTGTNQPEEGDVVVFRESASNKYGHVAVCLFATKNKIVTFEQDGFNQTGAKIGMWDYSRLLGWLRKKDD